MGIQKEQGGGKPPLLSVETTHAEVQSYLNLMQDRISFLDEVLHGRINALEKRLEVLEMGRPIPDQTTPPAES